MDDEAALETLAMVTAAMARTVGEASPEDLTAPVPACPGWDVTALVEHLGCVHLWAEHCARTGSQPVPYPSRDPDAPLARWYAGCTEILVAGLAGLGPDHPSWSFSVEPGHQRAAFWRRRQVHETAVHHVDALQALGRFPTEVLIERVPALDTAWAADGVGELLEVMVPRSLVRRRHEAPEQVVPAVAPVGLACTDTAASWTLRLVGGRARTEPGVAGDAVAVVRGPAAHLYLALWHRADPGALSVEGDLDAGRRLLAASLVP
jgi:uncharacterized protein (TIGR03083 family)